MLQGGSVSHLNLSTNSHIDQHSTPDPSMQRFLASYGASWDPSKLPRPVPHNQQLMEAWIRAVYVQRQFFVDVELCTGAGPHPLLTGDATPEAGAVLVIPMSQLLGEQLPRLSVSHPPAGNTGMVEGQSVEGGPAAEAQGVQPLPESGAPPDLKSAPPSPAVASNMEVDAQLPEQVQPPVPSAPSTVLDLQDARLPETSTPAGAWDPFGTLQRDVAPATKKLPGAPATQPAPEQAALPAKWTAFGEATPAAGEEARVPPLPPLAPGARPGPILSHPTPTTLAPPPRPPAVLDAHLSHHKPAMPPRAEVPLVRLIFCFFRRPAGLANSPPSILRCVGP